MELMKTFDKFAVLANLKNMMGGGKPNPVTSIMENPEDYKLEAYIEGDEIVVRFKKRRKSIPARPINRPPVAKSR